MINYIYCYTNLINSKTYVGQTNNIDRRIREHKSNAFNSNSVNYNNIIHKAFRKYGYENFSLTILEVLENVSQDVVNDREIYWIKEKHSLINQNGYNILKGGRNKFWKSIFSANEIKKIKALIAAGTPYNEICLKYGISKTFISDINNGKYFYDQNCIYPLCAYRIEADTYDLLIEDLEKPELTFKQLAEKYNLAESTIKKFNYGTLRKGYYNGEYLIRKITPQDYKANLAIDLLLETELTKKEICRQLRISAETLRQINLGQWHKKNNLIYPLRR